MTEKDNQKSAEVVVEASCFDDLAFEMYVEQEVAELLKQLEDKKRKAVLGNCSIGPYRLV